MSRLATVAVHGHHVRMPGHLRVVPDRPAAVGPPADPDVVRTVADLLRSIRHNLWVDPDGLDLRLACLIEEYDGVPLPGQS